MEENVALDSSKQKKFLKSIKGLKKIIKKNNALPESDSLTVLVKGKGKSPAKKRKERGLVYLSHIPHGFYEHEMTQYCKQFGLVTNARVIRSKRTGRSKGCAFVEFREPSVGQIVAETMNNYLMGKRLIKAVYIPPEKQRLKARRKHWNTVNNPSLNLKKKLKKAFNEDKDEKGDLKKARTLLSNLRRTKKKLSALGINYDHFMAVDIPDALIKAVEIKVEKDDGEVKDVKDEKPEKLSNKENQDDKIKKAKKSRLQLDTKTIKTQSKCEKAIKKKSDNIKPLENFIKVEQDSNDESDSSLGFDSDEYEKMLENETSDDDNSESSDEGDASNEEHDIDIKFRPSRHSAKQKFQEKTKKPNKQLKKKK